MDKSDLPSFLDPIALFPLPNAVLLPGDTLPMQVFEDRYRVMIEDALAADGLVAIALLRPGYEDYYHTNKAEIHPVTCVGKIREHLKIPDGNYFINLVGLCRARVRQEDREGTYRVAMLDPMIEPTSGIEKDGEFAAKCSLRELLSSRSFDLAGDIDRIRGFLDSGRPLGEVVDLVASGLLGAESVELKQRLLEEMHVTQRAQTLLGELRVLARFLEMRQRNLAKWPRFGPMN